MKNVCVWLLMATAIVWSATDRTTAAATDIVLYASDVSTLQGNWSKTSNASSPGGQMLASADAGWSSTSSPLPAPADYVEATFSAPAGTAYHVWLRLRASGNSKWNDSVYVQFDDAVDANGSALYRIGTTNGLMVNLESCNACGVAGWGWQDGAYWLSQIAIIRFAGSSSHRIRIQTREDGVQLDQIVLSPSNYLSSSPGQVTNDATIVSKPSSQAPSSGAPTPFSGSPVAIPGTIQASNFDNGREGVAYHDTTSGNAGGAYRQTDVDIESSSEGGYDIGWTAAGEWLGYSVNVANSGGYTAQLRVASPSGATMHVGFSYSSTAVAVPATGGWQNWTTVSVPVTLSGGSQQMWVLFDTGGANFSYVTFVASSNSSPSSSGPYLGSPVSLPGTVRASDFDNGGEGVAYHDTTSGNAGGAYRNTDVDLQASSEGGYNVGWADAGEWLDYTVSVASAGSYTAQMRVASPGGGGMHLGFNTASNEWENVTVPATGDWQAWTTVNVPVTLGAGQQQMTLFFDTEGINLLSVTVVAAASSTPPPPPPPPPPSGGGSTVTVPAGGNLQAAIDAAQPGDTILLVSGATYSGSFVLPVKSGSSWVTIRSAASDAVLPAAGVRIVPQYASQLPKIQGGAAGMSAFITAPGAHHYRLQFLEIVSSYAENNIVQLGDGNATQNSLSQVPHDLIVDRCYIHGDATQGQKRGIALNSASTSIVNSYISDIKSPNEDTQAIMAWNGPGPYTIENNYLEAAGENLMIGGADPAINGLVPSDISFRYNTVTKPLAWRGQSWVIKNLVEFKNAQRVTIDNNIIENSWAAAQGGYAILVTPVNQDGGAWWVVTQSIHITNNTIRHVGAGVNILGIDPASSTMTNDIVVSNNLFLDVSSANWGGDGRVLQTLGGQNIVFDHNTAFTDGTSAVYADLSSVSGFVFTNNIIPDNAWAVKGSGTAEGLDTLNRFYPGAVFQGNVIIGASASIYPGGNFFPAAIAAVGFTSVSGGNFALMSSSPYHNAATDGTDVGCLISQLIRWPSFS